MQDLNLERRNIQPEDKADIVELQNRIVNFRQGKEDEEKFKLYRLTRGVYGQRQLGVHMFRLKIPSGKITVDQLITVAEISDEYATGNLHLTTRQNIQLHYVRLEDSPSVWARLAESGLTAREACGNTVRNITASPKAGIDPDEIFDVTPYVDAVFKYFLRNPICQEMGRKIKPAFSSSEKDSAYTYFSDFGFIPKIKNGERGFKLVIGGGLGALAIKAQSAFEFIRADKIIPFIEASLRVFDRYGEREKRQKARMKFLLKDLGVDGFLNLVEEELKFLEFESVFIEVNDNEVSSPTQVFTSEIIDTDIQDQFILWKQTNTFSQKQNRFVGVYVNITLGDLSSDKARALAEVTRKYAADDIRITITQNLLIRYVLPQNLSSLYQELRILNLADPGISSISDITACPGTDTCNLGVTNSTGLTLELKSLIHREYSQLLKEINIDIKISGCMNSCGQHMASAIGFHGSSIKHNGKVIPAMQVVVGGGVDKHGIGHVGDKVIKLPTKRIPEAVSELLRDYDTYKDQNESYIHYAKRQGRRYFYQVLKKFSSLDNISDEIYMDWGQNHLYNQAIGVGECAGVILDVVGSILKEAEERLAYAKNSLKSKAYADAVYHAYSTYVITAKASLLQEDIKCNTHVKIIEDFQTKLVDEGLIPYNGNFINDVLLMKKNQPDQSFAEQYINGAEEFLGVILQLRTGSSIQEKQIVESYYKA